MRKLNTLIAVLEVACAKVRRSLAGPNPDVERLTRIQNNLKETLQVCVRAKRALERTEADAAKGVPEPSVPAQLPAPEGVRSANDSGELRTLEEQRKFQRLGPIDLREVRACDLDELCQKLAGEL